MGTRGGGTVSSWKVVLSALFGVIAVGLVHCTALPGGSLDPLVPTLGLYREEERPAQPRPEAPAPAEASGRARSQPSHEVQPRGGLPTQSAWSGRYRDTRGEGEIALTLMEDGSALGGTWRFRTGGSGTFAGTLAPDGRTPSFSMRVGDRECVATVEGVAAYAGDRISGSYRGADCHGAVGDGRLDLWKR
ncbi:MAG: hypothetical protein HY278_03705 [candidate division NC10 bacterium]|nr:hypothetical protein [candidate division NC10 bacterium]